MPILCCEPHQPPDGCSVVPEGIVVPDHQAQAQSIGQPNLPQIMGSCEGKMGIPCLESALEASVGMALGGHRTHVRTRARFQAGPGLTSTRYSGILTV